MLTKSLATRAYRFCCIKLVESLLILLALSFSLAVCISIWVGFWRLATLITPNCFFTLFGFGCFGCNYTQVCGALNGLFVDKVDDMFGGLSSWFCGGVMVLRRSHAAWRKLLSLFNESFWGFPAISFGSFIPIFFLRFIFLDALP